MNGNEMKKKRFVQNKKRWKEKQNKPNHPKKILNK